MSEHTELELSTLSLNMTNDIEADLKKQIKGQKLKLCVESDEDNRIALNRKVPCSRVVIEGDLYLTMYFTTSFSTDCDFEPDHDYNLYIENKDRNAREYITFIWNILQTTGLASLIRGLINRCLLYSPNKFTKVSVQHTLV